MKKNKLWKKVSKMDLGNPVITALVGLVIFYIGLKTFSGGMKAMGNMDHLAFFLGNPIYMWYSHDTVVAIIVSIDYRNYCVGCFWCTTVTCGSCGSLGC